MTLTDGQRGTVVNALHVAARLYIDNAQELREMNKGGGPAHYGRLAEQFERQYHEAMELADYIEASE